MFVTRKGDHPPAHVHVYREGALVVKWDPQISPLSRRELIRRLGTPATQFYRLLDQTDYRKSVDQLVSLLQVLDCDVDLVVRAKGA